MSLSTSALRASAAVLSLSVLGMLADTAQAAPKGSGLAGRGAGQVVTQCTAPNTVALTFDDGPYIYMTEVVDALKNAGAKATFFVNGDNWSCIYDEGMAAQVKYAYDSGFQIASHTWSHKDLSTLSKEQLDSEMSRTEEAIKKITGATPAFTRPPYGSYSELALEVATARGQTLVTWNFDSEDSQGADANRQMQLYDAIIATKPASLLVLQHEVYEASAREVLLYAIKSLQSAGYQLVTLAECLGEQPYLSLGEVAARDDSWQCAKW